MCGLFLVFVQDEVNESNSYLLGKRFIKSEHQRLYSYSINLASQPPTTLVKLALRFSSTDKEFTWMRIIIPTWTDAWSSIRSLS